MAYTRIHAIKSTVTKAVAYICNPDKTEQQLLVDSFGCHPDTAKHDFDYALFRTKSSDKNLAYHLIQSFAKGEVSLEEAHRIGIELADKLLGGKYSYVVATHTDKGHPHNHIIFCAADNIDHKKYNVYKKTFITSDSSAMNYAKNTIFLSSSKVAEKVKSMWIGKPSRTAAYGDYQRPLLRSKTAGMRS